MRGDGKPTIYDVAAASGASASTVSAALGESWKLRRIRPETVEHVRRIAAELGYTANRQARGLRQARSGLVGMILPVHDNRFFSSLSQHFATEVRRRGSCPVIVSTRRESAEEARTVEDLLSFAVDALMIAGANDPDALSAICREADLPHVFLDLPAAQSPSVVGDNATGAARLTNAILDGMRPSGDRARDRIYFLGGDERYHATALRVSAFRRVVAERTGELSRDQVLTCGYAPSRAALELDGLIERLGGLPAGLLVNSISVFEGVLGRLAEVPPDAVAGTVVGCYDYDPFGAFLQLPVHMVAQNAREMIARAFALLDANTRGPVLEMVAPELVPPRTILADAFAERG